MVKAKSTHMQVAKDVARALGDLFGWGDDAAKTFATSEIKDIRPARPYGGISATVYAGMDKFVPFSADSDWPNSPAIGEKTAEIQVIEGVSPKAVKGVFMVRALLKQAATKTGNAKVDQEIADAKKLAADSWTNWVATELFADLLIVRKTDSKKADDALRVISGSKYEDAKAKLDSAFEDGSVGGPLVGRMTLSEGAWLGPAVGATVLRLIAAQ
jgi:hypothetical protein